MFIICNQHYPLHFKRWEKPINYLYIGYQNYIDIAEKYQDDRFVVVTPTVFSQIKDMLEYSSCPACHAEMNCIISASRDEMLGATLYLAGYITSTSEENLNVEPCEICLRLIKNAGIDKVIVRQGIIYSRDRETKVLKKRV